MKHTLIAPMAHEYTGTRCPCCGKQDTMEGQDLDPGDNEVSYDMLCTHCGATWTEEYELVGYRSLEDGEGKAIEIPVPGGNEARAACAEAALKKYARASNNDGPDTDALGAVNDLLTNLRHWCAQNGVDFNASVRMSENHYLTEK